MKAIEQHFPVYCLLCRQVVLTFESVGEILRAAIQMKATEHYFPVVWFIMLYKVVLTNVSVGGRNPKYY